MGLCRNRPEGFGPKSSLSAPLPTTCFTDTILLPFPIFLLPILLLAALLLAKRHYTPSTSHIRARPLRTCAFKTLSVIYYVFIIVNILMEILELVRLALIKFSVSLLPLVIVGLLAGGILHATKGAGGRIYMWQGINIFLWVGGMVFSVVKTVGLALEGMDARKGSKYPVVDQVTDTGVVAGVYLVLIVLECALWSEGRGRGRRAEEESLGSPVLQSGRFGDEFGGQRMK